jgi:ABC-type multidrug transport system permease subunit
MINTLVFSILIYNLSGLRSGGGYFFYFYYVMFASSFSGLFLCMFMSALAPSTPAALSYFPMILFFVLAFSGFIIYLPDFPPWLGSWAPYFSVLRYSFQGLVLNEFSNNGDLPDEQSYLDNLGFNDVSQSACGGILVIFFFFFAAIQLMALKYIDYEAR